MNIDKRVKNKAKLTIAQLKTPIDVKFRPKSTHNSQKVGL
jgi:hypothetical protein